MKKLKQFYKKSLKLTNIVVLAIAFLTSTSITAQTWQEIIKIAASDRAATDYFGFSVAISGNYAIVGAYNEDEDANGGNTLDQAGAAYIFENDGAGNWTQVQKIVASDRAEGDYFGWSVAISGNYAIVGAAWVNQDVNGGNTLYNVGAAYIFENDGAGNWTQVQKIVASDRAEGDYFGKLVAISGNYAIVGVPNCNISDQNEGAVYIFENDGAGNWTQVQKILASDREANDGFGESVAISGNYAIVGSSNGYDANGGNTLSQAGSAYIFELDGVGNWTQVQKIVASDRAATDYFGFSVAISSNYAIVGASGGDEVVSGGSIMQDAGAAYIFERDGAGNWAQVDKIWASDRAEGDYFGGSVSISGNYAIVGAYNEDEDANGGNTLDQAGSAYIFENDGAGNWAQVQKIVASDREEYDNFGASVAISGNYAIGGGCRSRF